MKKFRFALSLLISYIAVRGFRFDFGAKVLVSLNLESFTWLLLFLFFLWFFNKSLNYSNKRLKACAITFGLIIACFQVVGRSLERMTGIAWIGQDKNMLINFLNILYGYFSFYYAFAFLTFSFLEKKSLEQVRKPVKKIQMKYVFLVWIALLICYIPWYLYFFPGILTYDSGAQVADALSVNSISDHNPAFVTLLIRAVLLPMMKLTNSIVISVGVCTGLQMLIVTFIFALCFVRICGYIQNSMLRTGIFIWFALHPINNIYSFTMWKDILFSVCVLGFTIILDSCTEDENTFFQSRRSVFLLFLTLVLLPLLRHNGIIITAAMILILPLRFKDHRKKLLLITCSAMAIFGIWKMILLPAMGARKSPAYELLNVPLQQISRVLYNHNHDISPWLLDDIRAYFDDPEFYNDYMEKIADPIKGHFRNNVYEEDPGKFFSLWRQLGKLYPVEYLEAFLHNNYGYWFPETTWWITGRGVIINIPIEGLKQSPIVQLRIIDKIYDWYINGKYLKVPILPLLFKPGAYWWVWVYCGIYAFYANRRKFVLFSPDF